ncbi:hypothetical protein FRC12_010481 [Ceratobasidium sp. 428]|nr:hypothetical protein FRC12_010481 [Ceratobasidium sp. 428]
MTAVRLNYASFLARNIRVVPSWSWRLARFPADIKRPGLGGDTTSSFGPTLPLARTSLCRSPRSFHSTTTAMSTFYDLKAASPRGEYNFDQLKGKVVLIVNVASKWQVDLSPRSQLDHSSLTLNIVASPLSILVGQDYSS